MAVLLNKDVPWVSVPVKVNYFFLNDDHDKNFNFIHCLVNRNGPANPKPSNLGFETRPVCPIKIRDQDNLETISEWSVY